MLQKSYWVLMPSQPWQLYHDKLKADGASPNMLTKMTLTFINILKINKAN